MVYLSSKVVNSNWKNFILWMNGCIASLQKAYILSTNHKMYCIFTVHKIRSQRLCVIYWYNIAFIGQIQSIFKYPIFYNQTALYLANEYFLCFQCKYGIFDVDKILDFSISFFSTFLSLDIRKVFQLPTLLRMPDFDKKFCTRMCFANDPTKNLAIKLKVKGLYY